MKGGRLFRTKGIKEGGERVTNVTRIITELDDDFTVRCYFSGDDGTFDDGGNDATVEEDTFEIDVVTVEHKNDDFDHLILKVSNKVHFKVITKLGKKSVKSRNNVTLYSHTNNRVLIQTDIYWID